MCWSAGRAESGAERGAVRQCRAAGARARRLRGPVKRCAECVETDLPTPVRTISTSAKYHELTANPSLEPAAYTRRTARVQTHRRVAAPHNLYVELCMPGGSQRCDLRRVTQLTPDSPEMRFSTGAARTRRQRQPERRSRAAFVMDRRCGALRRCGTQQMRT